MEAVTLDVDFCVYTGLNPNNLNGNKPTVAKGLDIREDSDFYMGYWGVCVFILFLVCILYVLVVCFCYLCVLDSCLSNIKLIAFELWVLLGADLRSKSYFRFLRIIFNLRLSNFKILVSSGTSGRKRVAFFNNVNCLICSSITAQNPSKNTFGSSSSQLNQPSKIFVLVLLVKRVLVKANGTVST